MAALGRFPLSRTSEEQVIREGSTFQLGGPLILQLPGDVCAADKCDADQRGPVEEIKTFAGHQFAALPWFSDRSVLASKSIFRASAVATDRAAQLALVLGTITTRRYGRYEGARKRRRRRVRKDHNCALPKRHGQREKTA